MSQEKVQTRQCVTNEDANPICLWLANTSRRLLLTSTEITDIFQTRGNQTEQN